MTQNTSDKPLSQVTAGEFEAMLERVFTKVAYFAVTQSEVERRAMWECEPHAFTVDEINTRSTNCDKVLARSFGK